MLDKYIERQGGFTKKRYLEMCRQLGKKPKPEEMPLDISDFPPIVRDSIDIYNRLGDRFTSTELGPLYNGKDYSLLNALLDLYTIRDEQDKRMVLNIAQHLDAAAIKKAVEAFNAKAREIQRKSN